MKIERLTLRGMLRFHDEVSVDFRDLPPGLIAIVGENGSGKTALLETAPGTLWRQFPSRGDRELVDYATERDSFIETVFSLYGRGEFRARVNLDGPKRVSDAVLEQVLPDGRNVPLTNGLVTSYDAYIAEHFPPKDLVLASAFAAQNRSGSFVTLDRKGRKTLFAQLLGLEHYETMSSTARQAAALIDRARGRLLATRDVLARDCSDTLVADLDRLAQELQARGGNAEVRRHELKGSIADHEARLAIMQDVVAAFAAATQRLGTLQRELTFRRQERQAVDEAITTAGATLAQELQRLATKRDADLADLTNRIAGNQKILESADAIRAAVASVADLDRQIAANLADRETQQQAETSARADLRSLEQQIAALKGPETELTRAQTDARLLASVPCAGVGIYAACQLLTTAQAAKARILELEARVAGKPALADAVVRTTQALETITRALVGLKGHLQHLELQKADHQKTAQYAEPLAAAEARIRELEDRRQQLERDATAALSEAQARHDHQVEDLRTRAAGLETIIARLVGETETAEADLSTTAASHEQAGALQAALQEARREWDQTTATLASVEAGRQDLDRRRAALADKRRQLADVTSELARLDLDLMEWQLLAKAFGREGLPVLEIDAAGPTVSSFCNDLLTAAFGPRFTVELVTQEAKAGGKGLREAFELKVLDNLRGGDARDITDLSGGEQVIVDEALKNALAIYANQRQETPMLTLFRDETTGALDEENGPRYVDMLRRVRELGGFHHAIFVSHNPDCAAMADAQIRVHDGHPRTVLPPFSEEA
jgi:exonuclease SbcC